MTINLLKLYQSLRRYKYEKISSYFVDVTSVKSWERSQPTWTSEKSLSRNGSSGILSPDYIFEPPC